MIQPYLQKNIMKLCAGDTQFDDRCISPRKNLQWYVCHQGFKKKNNIRLRFDDQGKDKTECDIKIKRYENNDVACAGIATLLCITSLDVFNF